MKRVLLVLSVLWVAKATAEDSWLYWMLGNASGSGYTATEAGTASADNTYSYVKVRGYTNNDTDFSYLNLYYDYGSSSLGDSISATTISEMNGFGAGLYAQLVSGTSYSSFVIELVNDSGFVADSERLSVASAVAHIETANSMHLPTAWAPVSYAIPEPNSAMLLLLGCAALGLRRRRQLKA